jgi:Outer membrane protein
LVDIVDGSFEDVLFRMPHMTSYGHRMPFCIVGIVRLLLKKSPDYSKPVGILFLQIQCRLKIAPKMTFSQFTIVLRLAKGAYWPTISFEGQYYDSEDSTPVDPDYNFSGTVSLNYAFFDGGVRSAEVAQTKIEKNRCVF